MPKADEKKLDFERALEELETLVERMEAGELSLEESLTTFERGMALSKACQQALDAAEQRIRVLVEKEGEPTTEAFEPSEDERE